MKDFLEGLEVFSGLISPLLISFFACLTLQAKHGWRGLKVFLREYAVCAFMGVIFFWGLDYFDLPPTVDAAIIASSSYASMRLLDVLSEKLVSIIKGVHAPGIKEEAGNEE